MATDDDPRPTERQRPSLDLPHTVLDALGEKTGQVSRIHLREDDSGQVSTQRGDAEDRDQLPEGRGNYKMLGEIARGGMGVVLRSHDTDLGRDVAMKVLSKELAGRPEVVQRFVEEAQIGGQLQHPGVVPVYELGLMADDRPYFTMKLVKGRTLAALLSERKSPDENRARLLSIFESICQTAAYAHSKGVIHRDLKPANVMVGAFGEVQVVDWGLAKVLGSGGVADEMRAQQSQLTVIETVRSGPGSSGSDSLAGSVLGTPAYMSLEQANGELEKVDERSDVFALGAILCEILTGQPPYVDTADERVIVQAARARLDPARERIEAAATDPELKELCLECLTANRSARPRDAGEVARRVHEHLSNLEQRAHDAELSAARERVEASELRRRQRLTLALAATVVISLVGLGAGARFMEKQSTTRRQAELASVHSAVDDARDRVATLSDEERYAEALEVARAGLERVDAAGVEVPEARVGLERLIAQTESRVTEQARRADLAERNAALLARCDELRMLQIESNFGFTPTGLTGRLDEMYAAAFRDYGIDLEADDLPTAMETLRASGIAVEVGLALDDWASVRRPIHGADSSAVEAITALALDLDQDPARSRVREALLAFDQERLLELARNEDLAQLPASTLWVLSEGLAGLDFAARVQGLASITGPVPEEMFRVVRSGIEAHPDDFLLNFRFGDLLHNRDEPRAAIQYLMAARAIRPDNGAVHGVLGDALSSIGDAPGAMRAYRRATELRPDYVRIHGFVGQSALICGEYELAIESYERQLQISPGNVEPQFLRDIARSYAGEIPLAPIADRAEAEGNKSIDGWIAWSLATHPDPGQRDPQRALRVYARYPSWGRGQSIGHLLAQLQAGKPRAALALMEDHSGDYGGEGPWRTIGEFARAEAYHRLGEPELAREHLQRGEELWKGLEYYGEESWAGSALAVFCAEVSELVGE